MQSWRKYILIKEEHITLQNILCSLQYSHKFNVVNKQNCQICGLSKNTHFLFKPFTSSQTALIVLISIKCYSVELANKIALNYL